MKKHKRCRYVLDVRVKDHTLRHWFHMIRIWNKLVLMDDSRITKRMFNYDNVQCQNNSWNFEVKSIFDKINMTYSYETKETVDVCLVKQNIFLTMLNHGPPKVITPRN